jgi:hypothetical protein
MMVNAYYTRDVYFVETSADMDAATRIAREVAGREPTDVLPAARRLGFRGEPDYNTNLLVPITFTCRAVLEFPTPQSARAVTWALRRSRSQFRRCLASSGRRAIRSLRGSSPTGSTAPMFGTMLAMLRFDPWSTPPSKSS